MTDPILGQALKQRPLQSLIAHVCVVARYISRFSPRIDRIFTGKRLIHILVLNFVLHNCILVFDAEQVHLKLRVTNLTNKEVTVNPKPQTLEKYWFFENPIPYTLNPEP